MPTTAAPDRGDGPRNPVSLLSLDAGGPQGVSQLLILKDVMEKLSKDENGDSQWPVKRPCEVFDMIGGAGTGGLIAIFLVILKMTAKDALDEFTNFVAEVFKNVARDPRKQTGKLTWTIYGILERHGIAKDAKLVVRSEPASKSKLMVPIMYKNHVGSPCVLRNYTPGHEPPVDLTIAEAMLATCSTPPIFTPTTISKDFSTFEYVSGDLGLSNPTREIIAEAHRAFGDERTVSCLLSIGCGHPGVNAVPTASGGTAWIDFVERVAMDSEKTAQNIGTQMSQLTFYHRLSVNRGLEKDQVREWTDSNFTTAHTMAYLNDLNVVGLVDRCVDTIKHRDGFTTLERLRHSGGVKVLSPPLPPLAANYVERKLPMEFIEKALFEEGGRIKSGSKRIVVTGIGGCGKTQLIRKFIVGYEDLFASTFFIDGSSTETIRRDIVRYVRALGGAHSQKSFDESMVFLSQALQNGERLLIIDNVDEPSLDLTLFLPRWQNGVVIVTSRNHSRGQLGPTGHLQLDVMTPDESAELLVRGSGKPWPAAETERKLAVSVAEELGCHPIALVQAVSYMYNTGCPPESYISLLRSNRDRLLRHHPATSQVDMRYKTAFAAFDASYSILPPKAQRFWHLLSFFRWQGFPVELISLAAQDDFSTDRPFLPRGDEFELGKRCLEEIFFNADRWEPLELHSILGTLRSHSLITTTSADNATLLQMHPLVHEWGRLRIPEERLRSFEAAAVRLLCCGASKDNYTMMQYLSSQVESLSFLWEGLHANDVASLAFILGESGMYEKSATLKGIGHAMVKRELGPEHLTTIRASSNLAVAYCQLGRYAEAEELLLEVLQQQKQQLGVDHPDTILASANLAASYHGLGRYAEAAALKAQVLRQQKQILGADHPDTIWASERLAVTYHVLGRYAEAEDLKTEVLRRRKQLLGADHPDTVTASDQLAVTYYELGRYTEAEELQRAVLQQRKQTLGVDHPDTIRASDQLAVIYYELGRYTEAEELQTEVLRRRKQMLGADHPDTVTALGQLAVTYHVLGRYAEAEDLKTEVLRRRKQLLGADHPDTVTALGQLAVTYYELGRYTEAEELQRAVLRRRKQLLGADHPDTIRASAHLAATYHQLGRHTEAEERKREVLRQRKQLFGEDHPMTIRASAELAVVYYDLKRYAKAEEMYDEVVKKRTTLLGEQHPDTIRSMLYLAQTYDATQRQSEASSLAQKALRLALETLGDRHPLYQEISKFLASLPEERPVRKSRSGRFAPYKKRAPRK